MTYMTKWTGLPVTESYKTKVTTFLGMGAVAKQAGGRVPPRDFWPGNFCWPTGKREAREKKGKGGKRRKFEKGKVENWKCKEERFQNEERTFLFCFVVLFCFVFDFVCLFVFCLFCFVFVFCFSLLKTTEISFGSTRMEIFYREKFPVSPLNGGGGSWIRLKGDPSQMTNMNRLCERMIL